MYIINIIYDAVSFFQYLWLNSTSNIRYLSITFIFYIQLSLSLCESIPVEKTEELDMYLLSTVLLLMMWHLWIM